jgi:hypothetical protein
MGVLCIAGIYGSIYESDIASGNRLAQRTGGSDVTTARFFSLCRRTARDGWPPLKTIAGGQVKFDIKKLKAAFDGN